MLGWFVSKRRVNMTMKDKVLIDEKDVEVLLENISDAILDQRVQIDKIYPYFTVDALFNIKSIITQKKSVGYRCSICKKSLENDDSTIGCDICLQWSHFQCQNINMTPSNKYWCCKNCRRSININSNNS